MKQIVLSGNLTSEPEVKILSDGKKVANFSIANNENKKYAEFYFVRAWNGLADWAEKYLIKGTAVFISGTFSIEKYTGADNTPRQKFVITAEVINFGEKRTLPDKEN